MNPLLIGMLIRWGMATLGAGAVASSPAVKAAPDMGSLLSALPHDWQLGIGAALTIASLALSYAQKRGWIKANEAPVEERAIP